MVGMFSNFAEKASFGIFKATGLGGSSDLRNPSTWLIDAMAGGSQTISGEFVTPTSVLKNPEFLAALKNISEDVAKLPMNVYRSLPNGGREKLSKHKLFNMLHFRANKNVSSLDFYQSVTGHAINMGNGYAEIVRNGKNEPSELHVIHPTRVTPFFREDANGEQNLYYEIKSEFSLRGKQMSSVILPAGDVLHIKGFGSDGIVGYPISKLVAEALGIGIAADNFSAAFYGNGTTLSGALETPHELSDKAHARLRRDWNRMYKGAKNAQGLAILEAGMKYTPVSSDPEKSQLLETRKYHAIIVSRITRIPPHKIASMEAATFGNIEEQNIEYVRDCLTPWLRRWHLELTYKLFGLNSGEFAQFEISALSLGDSATRSAVYQSMFNIGAISPNEVREAEGLNQSSEPGMNNYFMQLNMSTVENISAGQPQADNLPSPAAMAIDVVSQVKSSQPLAIIDVFESHRAAYMPIFEAVANRLLIKEDKALSANIESKKNKRIDFKRWSEKFFRTQRDEIVSAFIPACQVFVNTFNGGKFNISTELLSDFAEIYASDGIEKADMMYAEYEKNGYRPMNIEAETKLLALKVVNLIGQSVKEVK